MDDEHVISRREFIKVTSIIGSGFAIGFNSLVGSGQLLIFPQIHLLMS